jgi:hypothetical protein
MKEDCLKFSRLTPNKSIFSELLLIIYMTV